MSWNSSSRSGLDLGWIWAGGSWDFDEGKKCFYPLVNIQKAMENHHAINGKSHYKWPFSIAMLVHQRVVLFFFWEDV